MSFTFTLLIVIQFFLLLLWWNIFQQENKSMMFLQHSVSLHYLKQFHSMCMDRMRTEKLIVVKREYTMLVVIVSMRVQHSTAIASQRSEVSEHQHQQQ